MAAQNSWMRPASPFQSPGNFAGSGSSPTQSIESFCAAARASEVVKLMRAAPVLLSIRSADALGERGAQAGVAARRHRQQPVAFRLRNLQRADEGLDRLAGDR